MSLKILDSPAPSENLRKRLKSFPQAPVVILDCDKIWLNILRSGERSLAWVPVGLEPTSDWRERLTQHPQLRGGGWLWCPEGDTELNGLPQQWKVLVPPWAWLGRWLLKEISLKNRHVGLLGPANASLENLLGWLLRQGASATWIDDTSRHLCNQLKLSDILLVFPGFRAPLEAHQINPGTCLVDFRCSSQGLAGNALASTLGAYADASTGALSNLLLALALSQQETLIELA